MIAEYLKNYGFKYIKVDGTKTYYDNEEYKVMVDEDDPYEVQIVFERGNISVFPIETRNQIRLFLNVLENFDLEVTNG